MTVANLEQELRELHEATFAWALHCCQGDRDEAQDVVQDTYLRLLDGALKFGGRSSFKTWLFSVVRRAVRDRRRRSTVRRVLLDRWLQPSASHQPAQEAASIKSERAHRVRGLLAELSTRQRQVLELVFFHDLPLREAAEVLQISGGSASRHYDRGKKAMMARLRESEIEL